MAARAARLLGTRGLIAGGYARDVLFNRVPKDMDIFVKIPEACFGGLTNPINTHYLMEAAHNIMQRYGQEPDEEDFAARQGAYGDGSNFIAIKAKPQDFQEWQPIDVVFNPNFTGRNPVGFIEESFDLDICKVFLTTKGLVKDLGAIAAHDRHYEVLTEGKAAKYGTIAIANRVKHLQEKYPTLGVRVDINPRHLQHTLTVLAKEGVLDAAREVLQEQAEGIIGDIVRLNDRADGVRQVLRTPFRGVTEWIHLDDIQGGTTTVQYQP